MAGVIGLCAWLMPICGWPLSLATIGLSVYGLKSSYRAAAIMGIGLGVLAFLASTANFLAGLVLNLP